MSEFTAELMRPVTDPSVSGNSVKKGFVCSEALANMMIDFNLDRILTWRSPSSY
jgi:hypothetical protein